MINIFRAFLKLKWIVYQGEKIKNSKSEFVELFELLSYV